MTHSVPSGWKSVAIGDLDAAVEEVAHDRAVNFFFSVDFEILGKVERQILLQLGEQSHLSLSDMQGVLKDLIAERTVNLPLNIVTKIARGADCLDNSSWWGLPKALF